MLMITRNMSYSPKFLDRFAIMLEDRQLEKLSSFRILVVGVGGVGSAVAHMLVRCGISNLGIVDFDSVDETNINRQMVAYHSNIGQYKVDALENQLKDINPELSLTKYNIKLDDTNIDSLGLEEYDYIVDCIDDLNAKKLLISRCYLLHKSILCAMGAGNRYQGVPLFEVVDISKTEYDPIAKILRKYCKVEGINKLQVCYTKQKPIKIDCKTIGSVVYYVVNMATAICAKVINDILKSVKEEL